MRTAEQKRERAHAYWRDLEKPRRYLVRFGEGGQTVRECDSAGDAVAPYPYSGATARLMGTHETVKQAQRRLGWN